MSQPPIMPNYQGQAPGAGKPAGLSIASMVLGIVSLVLFCFWYVSIPCGIVAVVLGAVARGKVQRGEAGGGGMAMAGLVCGIIAVALAILLLILAAIGITWFKSEIEKAQRMQSLLPSFLAHLDAARNIATSIF